jgi:hypothetical protein
MRTNRSARYEKVLNVYIFVKCVNKLLTLLNILNPNLVRKFIILCKK